MPTNLREIQSVSEILSERVDAGEVDKLYRFRDWQRKVYVTHYGATRVDFYRYLWFLRFGRPECWYTQPSDASIASMMKGSEDLAAVLLTPHIEATPSALNCPRICVTKAISSPMGPDCQLTDALLACKVADASNMEGDLRYISVVQASKKSLEHPGSSPYGCLPNSEDSQALVGASVFELVTTGSQESAAAQAFYDAGTNGWSTVFTCAFWDGDLGKQGVANLGTRTTR
ncbi:hypothetical protein LTS02_017907, partial [Friedmanniomyces endolithicus]